MDAKWESSGKDAADIAEDVKPTDSQPTVLRRIPDKMPKLALLILVVEVRYPSSPI